MPARRIAGVLALVAMASGCGGSDGQRGSPADPAPAAITYLRPDQWPTALGPWTEVGAVDLAPDDESNAGALALICGDVEFPAGSGGRGYTAGGFGRGDDRPGGAQAAADQYVSELADDAAAQEQVDVLVRQFRTCAGEIGKEAFQEYPSLDVADGVRVFGRFVSYPDGKRTSKLFAFGRAGPLVSVEVLYTGDRQKDAPRPEFETTVRTAMEQLAS